MFDGNRIWRWVLGAALVCLAAVLGLTAEGFVLPTSAHAQFWNDQGFPFLQPRPQRPQRSGGFFQNLFGGGEPEYQRPPPRQRVIVPQPREPAAETAHAPPPRKEAKSETPPSTTVVVMGDGMADWLAYGLEDAFSDSPDIGIVRKDKPYSGLLRYDAKGDLDWWHVARDILAQQKANYVVMMLGVSDRQNIRERDLAKQAEKDAKEEDSKKAADAGAHPDQQGKLQQKPDDADDEGEGRKSNGVVEFRSEQWEKIYNHRIDETIAALKSKGVPVFWVGLPAIRGTRSTADASYLNGLYRARAERAGIVYIDVWDGFVDENGKYTSYGPDYEGQMRRLRSADGVYFTKYGARKLAHYVEREIRRYMSNRVVALPTTGPAAPAAPSGKPAERPLAGPVVPLTALSSGSDELLGGGNTTGRVHGDALAAQVLVKGEAPPPQYGRADNFAWPPGSKPKPAVAETTKPAEPSVASAKAEPLGSVAAPAAAPASPSPAVLPPAEAKPAAAVQSASKSDAALEDKPPAKHAADKAHVRPKPKRAEAANPKPIRRSRADPAVPRPPRPVEAHPSNGPFGGFFGVFR